MTNRMLDVNQIVSHLEKRGVILSPSSVYRLRDELPLVATGPRKAYRARLVDVDRWIESRIGIELW